MDKLDAYVKASYHPQGIKLAVSALAESTLFTAELLLRGGVFLLSNRYPESLNYYIASGTLNGFKRYPKVSVGGNHTFPYLQFLRVPKSLSLHKNYTALTMPVQLNLYSPPSVETVTPVYGCLYCYSLFL